MASSKARSSSQNDGGSSSPAVSASRSAGVIVTVSAGSPDLTSPPMLSPSWLQSRSASAAVAGIPAAASAPRSTISSTSTDQSIVAGALGGTMSVALTPSSTPTYPFQRTLQGNQCRISQYPYSTTTVVMSISMRGIVSLITPPRSRSKKPGGASSEFDASALSRTSTPNPKLPRPSLTLQDSSLSTFLASRYATRATPWDSGSIHRIAETRRMLR